jgi:hypothetical protein
MKGEFTEQYEQNNKRMRPIHVGDFVTLGIPRKKYLPDLIVFKVIKDGNGYSLIYHSGKMSDGDPNYKQKLQFQVYKVIGNIETGIDDSLLV